MSPPISYRVSMSQPSSHLFEVEAHFPPSGEQLTVGFPVWTPGSYLVREYERHVQELQVVDLADKPVPFTRLDKRTLRVESKNKPVRLKYKVYAHELTVRTSHLDDSHAYFNPACLFYFSEAMRDRQHRVAVVPPKGWHVTAALEQQGIEYLAKDFDTLVDTPFEVGTHQVLTFDAASVPHDVVSWGDPQLDEKKLIHDLTKIIETEAALFGGLPMKRYTFFLYCSDKGRGGLEHKDSTALLYPRTGFTNPKSWEDFLTLCAHEYLHLWNVKRIKPRALVPFDYGQENYTSLLWFFEGCTAYYDNLLVRRAGLMTGARYLTRLGESITALQTTPGREVMPLVDASMLAWVKHYRPDENSPNSAISYYLKGEIVCMLLDLHLRAATGGTQSMDDVLRLLWQRYGDESGVPEDGIEAAARELGGEGLADFFHKALRTTEELDYAIFATVGLTLNFRAKEGASDKGGSSPRKNDKGNGYVGLSGRGSSTIATVLRGSPALAAGLSAEDELVALDGYKVDTATFLARCEEKTPGDTVAVTVFRRDKMLTLPLVVGEKPQDTAWLARVDAPSETQKAAYLSWLGVAWDEAEKPEKSESKP